MRVTILLIVLLIFKVLPAQDASADLNGKIFRGTVTELTSPDVDRMPLFYNELIRFDNGKLYSDALKNFSVNESDYSAEIDGRRMIAVKVINFHTTATGSIYGETVNIEISGDIFGDAKMSGELKIKYQDGREVKFTIYATATTD